MGLLTPHDFVRIAAAGGLDPRTVRRVYEGKHSASTTRSRIVQTAGFLGLPPPPPDPALETEPEVA